MIKYLWFLSFLLLFGLTGFAQSNASDTASTDDATENVVAKKSKKKKKKEEKEEI